MRKNKINNSFYNGNHLTNKTQNFYFLVGARSIGKTYFFKRFCVENYKKTKEKFIFVRRYLSEIENIKEEFFDDLEENIIIKKLDIFLNHEKIGTFIPLTGVTKYKSVNMSEYNYIIFDEFLPEDDVYLKSSKNYHFEVNQILNLFQSVARGKGKAFREDVKVFFLANDVSVLNPYFDFFKIDKILEKNPEQRKITTPFYYYERLTNKPAITGYFAEVLKNTSYGLYALEGKSLLDNNVFIEPKIPKNSKHIVSVNFGDYDVSIHHKGGLIYFSELPKNHKQDINFSIIYKANVNNFKLTKLYFIIKNNFLITNRCRFGSQKIKKFVFRYF